MSNAIKLTQTLDLLQDDIKGSKVSFGDVVESFNHRGFGPLLLAPALMAILPLGAIPGVPAFAGLFIAVIALQMLMGRRYPWLPQRIKSFSFKRSKLTHAIRMARPYTQRLDKILKPRLSVLNSRVFQYLAASICVVLALLMVLIGFIPFFPMIISVPILFFALGFSAKDGAMTLMGFALTISALLLIGCGLGISCVDDRIIIGEPTFTVQNSYLINLDMFKDFR